MDILPSTSYKTSGRHISKPITRKIYCVGAIRNRLKNSGVEDVQSALNQMLKNKVIETLPGER